MTPATTKAMRVYQTAGGQVVREISGTAMAAVAGGPSGTMTSASAAGALGDDAATTVAPSTFNVPTGVTSSWFLKPQVNASAAA